MGQAINCEPEAQRACECKKSRKFKELLEKHLLTITTLTGVILGTVIGEFFDVAIFILNFIIMKKKGIKTSL